MYEKYIDQFMPSKDMQEYLKTQELTPYQIVSIIFKSPFSLKQKKSAFENLLIETNDVSLKELCNNCIENINRANYILANTNGVFNIKHNMTKYSGKILSDHGIYANYNHIIDYFDNLKEHCKFADEYNYFVIYGWLPNMNGKLENIIKYYVIEYEICYFEYSDIYTDSVKLHLNGFEPKFNDYILDLPTPFKNGDIVEFDNYPFHKETYSLILNNNEIAGSSLHNLYRYDSKHWSIGNVAHGYVGFSSGFGVAIKPDLVISPLYNVRLYNDELPIEYRILKRVKEACGTDIQKYDKLYFKEISEEELNRILEELI